MNIKALELLEYNKIKENVRELAVSELGKKLIDELNPSDDIDRVKNQLIETTEARSIMDKSSAVPIQNLVGIENVIEKLGKGTALNPEDLQSILGLLRSTKKLKRFMEERKYIAPTISNYAFSMFELSDVIEEIDRCIDNGRVVDKASTQLEKIRKKIYIAENRVKVKLDDIIKSPAHRKYLQENIVSIKNGRHVIAVKSEYRNNIAGSVIDKSSTGSTLFIEPQAVRKLQSELDLLKIDEEKEEYQILIYLTYMVESYSRELNISIETMAYYDYVFAKGKYSKSINGRSANVNFDGYIKINGGKHPMLGNDVVPLDFEVGNDYSALVITGPNTGGKTVALKTIGLFTAMIQSGLHVPVQEGSEFSIYSDILVDIGDGQSIEQSLSTFSAHVKNIIEIMKAATKYTLIILDELGAGTDPAEGEGLAVSVLEELYDRGSTIIATSHYSKVKTFATEHEGFNNGRMTFDIATLKPMYKLVIGEAGESNAFIIALRLGMKTDVIERAHKITYNEEKNYKSLLSNEQTNKEKLKVNYYTKAKRPKSLDRQKLTEENKKSIVEYNIGDVVYVHTVKQKGVVYEKVNKKGEVGVMVRNKKMLVQIKRLSPFLDSKDLYPEDYDMDIIFETKENRKKKKTMNRKYVKDMVREIE
ncbi:endonuclease MutS2 [Vallitalea guaymasensis]|uniref:Endonuclease MutS2 n=1 Tax=Vallitalea guaymasensis TaxID=1185412 RepID=A0A8J8SE96_9FIRM|nr:endonuclease MutS2 [Vallitalea guaymasensis]QUH31301.1 endonuclease MutS2 [Vallitalea guaymasensis]